MRINSTNSDGGKMFVVTGVDYKFSFTISVSLQPHASKPHHHDPERPTDTSNHYAGRDICLNLEKAIIAMDVTYYC